MDGESLCYSLQGPFGTMIRDLPVAPAVRARGRAIAPFAPRARARVMSHSETLHTQVLIVGGGPVGLALAIELGLRNIRCILVEQNEPLGPLQAPRSKMINARAMTHVRRWGLAPTIREAIPLGAEYPSNVIFATRLTGIEIARFENAFSTKRGDDERFPEGAAWLPQYRIEDVFRARASQLTSVTLLLGTRLEAYTQAPECVEATVSSKRGTQRVEARYIVAADGARSVVRTLAGIAMKEMPSASSNSANINALIRVPGLSQRLTLGPAVIYQIINREVSAGMGPFDVDDRWFINAFPQNWTGAPEDFDLTAFTQAAIGAPLPVEVICRSTWSPRALLAERYKQGRLLLVGDAAQVRPPTGGYGMNLGIGDAVDLAWKLAATEQGWGSIGLLETYELERKSVHRRVLQEALENYSFVDSVRHARIRPDDLEAPAEVGELARSRLQNLIQQQKEREYHTLGVVLGERYVGSPLVARESGLPPPQHFRDYLPSTYPGCLAPHLWLPDGRSLYDLFGSGFTLVICGTRAERAAADFMAAAALQALPLTALRLQDHHSLGLYPNALTLIRPDQHVAWRGDAAPADVAELLERVRGGGLAAESPLTGLEYAARRVP